MKVLVATENRFFKSKNGDIYSTTVCNYDFWSRYLQVFDNVLVFARLAEIEQERLDEPRANGPNVTFFALPYYIGPWEYLKHYSRLRALAAQAVQLADAFILRVPGTLGSLIWQNLMKKKIPFGVEVCGDPAGLSPSSIKSRIAYFIKPMAVSRLKKQCLTASATAYVSETYLQRGYPPNGWTTNFSSLELPDEAIVNETHIDTRLARIREVMEKGKRPFKICHVGSMTVFYKSQDTLIEAIAICRKKGLEISLTLVGDGRQRQRFEKRAAELDIKEYVTFAGRVLPGPEVIKFLDAADLFVLPSLQEGLPRAMIEATARALPCIATSVGGNVELLDPEDMIPPGDVNALSDKIFQVLNDIERLEKMMRRNLQTAHKYRSEVLNQRRINFYKRVMEMAGSSSTHKNG